IDQRDTADGTWNVGRNDFAVDRHQVYNLAECIAKLMAAVVEPEHADLALKLLWIFDARQWQDGPPKLDPQLPGSGADRIGFDFLDAVDDAEPKRTAGTVEPAEQKHRHLIGTGGNRRIDTTAGTPDGLQPAAANLGEPRGIEQQDGTTVIGQRGAGI